MKQFFSACIMGTMTAGLFSFGAVLLSSSMESEYSNVKVIGYLIAYAEHSGNREGLPQIASTVNVSGTSSVYGLALASSLLSDEQSSTLINLSKLIKIPHEKSL